MSFQYTSVIDPQKQIYLVHNAVLIQLPDAYRWLLYESKIDDSKYTYFLPLDDDLLKDASGISVVDATLDTEEPDISLINEENLKEADDYLRAAYNKQHYEDGCKLLEWSNMVLLMNQSRKCTFNRMTYSDEDDIYTEIVLRQSKGNNKYIFTGSYRADREERLHSLFMNTIIGARLIDISDIMQKGRHYH